MRMLAFAFALPLLFISTITHADVALDVRGGQLFGASDVPVGDMLFDVEFVDGTCVAVFDGCDESSDFEFATLADARLAGEVLLAEVFLDVGLGTFDTDPLLTNGCGPDPDLADCIVLIPYALDTPPPPEILLSGQVSNHEVEGNDFVFVDSGRHLPTSDWSADIRVVYARFTLLNVISLDIKPGNDSNNINPGSRGVIQVAILTTDTFDAQDVDPSTVAFGPSGASALQTFVQFRDVDHDGDADLVLRFQISDTGIACGDNSASLTGMTLGGELFEGSDSIQTVGCK